MADIASFALLVHGDARSTGQSCIARQLAREDKLGFAFGIADHDTREARPVTSSGKPKRHFPAFASSHHKVHTGTHALH